ncbi:MAG TPA: hypothetical protein VGS97_02745 [Actinocrinis sp.]|uniref:hypothetical protein n=1 Tax=Actinocrinis sp. TaxID=1920516 RepID=UPI002DDD0F7B|nr:hypothetical protein [Actinocrinis sp.]HEV2342989.1 hypothetical protein [Actinocrinis sp.]
MDDYVHWRAQAREWATAVRDDADEWLRDLEGAGSGADIIPRQRRGLVLINGGLSLNGQHEPDRGERWEDLALIELW